MFLGKVCSTDGSNPFFWYPCIFIPQCLIPVYSSLQYPVPANCNPCIFNPCVLSPANDYPSFPCINDHCRKEPIQAILGHSGIFPVCSGHVRTVLSVLYLFQGKENAWIGVCRNENAEIAICRNWCLQGWKHRDKKCRSSNLQGLQIPISRDVIPQGLAV